MKKMSLMALLAAMLFSLTFAGAALACGNDYDKGDYPKGETSGEKA